MSWSGGLITLALLFGLFVLWQEGTQHALEYYTGYLIELSLSVDNLFVFLLIFSYFGVRAEAQPKVLKWGILGAIVMRLIMIALGALLLERFHWIVYVFGAILVITGIKMYAQKDEELVHLEGNLVVRLARRVLPIDKAYDGTRFFTRTADGRRAGHAPAARGAGGGVVRPGVRHRQHPGHLRGYPRSVPGLQLQHLRHSRPPRHVLRAGGHAGQVRVPEARRRVHPRLRRPQDDAERLDPHPDHPVPGGDRADSGRRGGPVHLPKRPLQGEPGCRVPPKLPAMPPTPSSCGLVSASAVQSSAPGRCTTGPLPRYKPPSWWRSSPSTS